MKIDWSPLQTELSCWRSEKRALPLWWRDDDAIEPTPALTRLLKIGEDLGLPVHVAVIPKAAKPALAQLARETQTMIPLVHGWAHQNNAPVGAKKAEFGQPHSQARSETEAALIKMKHLFGADVLAMFVPPWNRIDTGVMEGLSAQGYVGVSTFTPRKSRQVAGVVQINTHIDPINWHGGQGLHAPEHIIEQIVTLLQDRRAGRTDAAEPLGFLSHHLVHNEDIWDFTKNCLSVLLEGGATPINLSTRKSELP